MSVTERNVWLDARQAFLPFDGVVGVGYGPKLQGERVVARQAVIVLVEKKLPQSKVRKNQMIPTAFRGLPTDVREPKLMLEEGEDDFCLTDHQWIDAATIHRMRLEQQGSDEDLT